MKTLMRWVAMHKAILTLMVILVAYFTVYAFSPRAGFVITFVFIAIVLWIDGVCSADWAQIVPAGPFLAIALPVAGLPFQAVLLVAVLVVAIGLVWSFLSLLSRDALDGRGLVGLPGPSEGFKTKLWKRIRRPAEGLPEHGPLFDGLNEDEEEIS